MSDQRGATAVVFGLAALPLIGVAGAAIDYSRATAAQAALQKAADATALLMVIGRHAGQNPNAQALFEDAMRDHSGLLAGLQPVSGEWLTPDTQFRIKVSGRLETTLFKILQPDMPLGVAATALGVEEVKKVTIEGANLDPQASDYNELSAYCYNQVTKTRAGPLDPGTGKRGPFVKISDNTDAGVRATPANIDVTCGKNENVSYLLKNVRGARLDPVKQRTGETYLHYTDTTSDEGGPNAGVQQYNTTSPILETILCETKQQCQPRAKGGILPNNNETGRTPQVATKACKAGQYMYFGWEDRPPNTGQWTDQDYDDIRFVVRCPETTPGPFNVRLTA